MKISRDEEILLAETYKRSYFEFFKAFWHTVSPDELQMNWHIEEICNVLNAMGLYLISGQPYPFDLVINVSPGESKSTIVTQLFPCWLWANDPTLKIISGSYSHEISAGHAVKSRDCIKSDLYKKLYPHVEIRKDVDSKHHYENTAKGERFATSVGGSATGKHASILIIDDPLSPKQAASKGEVKKSNDWINQTLSSRITNVKIAPTILVMQRLHEDDPTADFLEKREGKVLHLCYPANDEFPIIPESSKAKYVDGLMNPNRRDHAYLEGQKKKLGSFGFASQYGQQPQPMEGNLVKREWFSFIESYNLPVEAQRKRRDFVCDTAFTKQQHNDPSAVLTYFVHNNDLYIENYETVRFEFPELCKFLERTWNMKSKVNSKMYIEPKASGQDIISYLKRNTKINVIAHKLKQGGKESRFKAVTPFIEAGRIFLIKSSWNESFLEELLMFPNAKHDEAVDTLTMAIQNGLDRSNGFIKDPVVGHYNLY